MTSERSRDELLSDSWPLSHTQTHTQGHKLTHTFIKHKRDILDFLNLVQVHARCVYLLRIWTCSSKSSEPLANVCVLLWGSYSLQSCKSYLLNRGSSLGSELPQRITVQVCCLVTQPGSCIAGISSQKSCTSIVPSCDPKCFRSAAL